MNVRLRPNVICRKIRDADDCVIERVRHPEMLDRLSYWEKLQLSRENSLKYGLPPRAHRSSERHLREYEAFSTEGARELWSDLPDFKSMSGREDVVPFFQDRQQLSDSPDIEPGITQLEPADRRQEKPEGHSEFPDREEERRSQEKVINAPVHQSIIVLAPPGTGKTHSLIERICQVMESGEVDNPSEEIVVLSFTRAAVSEIVRRVAERTEDGKQDDLRYITVRTFDSFATHMLLKDLPPDDITTHGFDARIDQFTELLESGVLDRSARKIDQIRCLMVDEIQDLTGPRVDMVLELIRKVTGNGGGVVLLGDPAQGIYDWSVRDEDERDSIYFLEQARQLLEPNSLEIQFSNYYRYSSDMCEFVDSLRQAMGHDGSEPDGPAIHDHIHSCSEMKIQELNSLLRLDGSVAVLTRDNLQAYQLHRWCQQNELSSRIHGGRRGKYWPGWVGRLVLGFRQPRMSLQMAQRRWQEQDCNAARVSFQDAMEFLEEQRVLLNGVIELDLLRERIRQRTPFEYRERDDDEALLISTIHRSKGLEFDRVCVLDSFRNTAGDAEEVRVLYVAATRAKRELNRLKRDHGIFRPGYKNRYGLGLSHFHWYSDDVNWLLLEGIDDIDRDSIIEQVTVRGLKSSQSHLWESGSCGNCNLSVRRSEDMFNLFLETDEGDFYIAWLSPALSNDLRRIDYRYGFNQGGVQGMREVPVTDLATVAFPVENEVARDLLGAGRMAVVPVIRGEAAILMGDDRDDCQN